MEAVTKYFLFVCVFCSLELSALPNLITVGGIFDPYDQRQELAFRVAVQRVNAEREILRNTNLNAHIIKLPADDSFHAHKKVCDMLRTKVAAIFGPQSENTANHVQSICDDMEVPHIETRWNYNMFREEYSLNLYPHPASLSQAYHDIIAKLKWDNFVVIYDSSDGLVRLQSILKEKNFTVTVRQLPETDDYRPMLKTVKSTQISKFVLDVKQERILEVLKQAAQIGLMREYHYYFITSLDLHLVDMNEFRHSLTNITSIRLVDPEDPKVKQFVEEWKFQELKFGGTVDNNVARITTESALMCDAVLLFARALDNLDKSTDVQIRPLYCETDTRASHGSSLINIMKMSDSGRGDDIQGRNNRNPFISPHYGSIIPGINPQYQGMRPGPVRSNMDGMRGYLDPNLNLIGNMSFNRHQYGMQEMQVLGMTGAIKFDRDGFRTDVELDIIELDKDKGLTKVGVWTLDGGANFTRYLVASNVSVNTKIQNRTLIVTTALSDPYTMRKDSKEQLVGNDRYEGFCIDLIHMISEDLEFNYTFSLVEDGSYGSLNSETGEWNGMIRDLIDHKADLGIVDFTITYERERAVDFSMPFMDLGISIIYKKPSKKIPSLFSFMSPFSVDVWIYMATAYLGVSVLLFMLARIAPEEWDNPHPCIQDPDELENSITMKNAFWFTIGSLMQQGSDIAPKAVSTRIVAGIWWFFTLIMISSYTANLAAFLTVERMDSPISSAEDLAKQTKIKYGCKEGGSTYAFFRDSKIPTYASMWTAMNNARPSVFTQSNSEGVDRVSKGGYAFMMESSSIDYTVERKCDLMQVGGPLDSKSYGIGLPAGSPYTSAITQSILKLKESGELHTLRKKWWKERKGGGKCKVDEDAGAAGGADELDLDNVGGVFVVLIGGMITAALMAVCEFMWNARELATDESDDDEDQQPDSIELGLGNVGGVFLVMGVGCAMSCFIACCEFTWKARKIATEVEDTFLQEIWKEFKFVFTCSENVKTIRKKPSPTETEASEYSPEVDSYAYSTNNPR